MPDKPKPDGVFISCVSDEFEKDTLAGSGKDEVGSSNDEGVWRNVDPKAVLAKAAKFIHQLGYGRRHDELAVAEAAAKEWST